MYTTKQFTKDIDAKYYYDNYVNVNKFLELCKDCSVYNKNWSCPPFDFNPEDIWLSFTRFKIIAIKIEFSKELLNMSFTKEGFADFFKYLKKEKRKLVNNLYKLEKEYDDCLALFLGECDLCSICARIKGEECYYPNKMRHSIESIGGDVDKIVEDLFSFKILWPDGDKLPEYIFLVGGLLYNEV